MNLIDLLKVADNNNQRYLLCLLHHYSTVPIIYTGINIFSYRQILEEVELECSNNRLAKKNYRELLIRMISRLNESGYLLDGKQRAEFKYLVKKISEGKELLVKESALRIKGEFCNKKYFDKRIDKLRRLLKNNETDYSKEIKFLIDSVVVDLMYQGFSMRNICTRILGVFSLADESSDTEIKFPRTSFPLGFIDDNVPIEKYSQFINALTFDERVNYIKKFYSGKKHEFYVVMPVKGITLSDETIKCTKDIVLYNPEINDLFSEGDKDQNEAKKYYLEEVDYSKCSNACVKVLAFNNDMAFKEGAKKLNDYLDTLRLQLPNRGLRALENYMFLLDDKKEFCYCELKASTNDLEKREFESRINPIKVHDVWNREDILASVRMVGMIFAKTGEHNRQTANILLNAARKFSEGLDNRNSQEAILKFWSSIECLFNDNLSFLSDGSKSRFLMIKEFLSSFLVYYGRYGMLYELYRELEDATGFRYYAGHREEFSIFHFPDELLKELNLYKSDDNSYSLLRLTKHLKDIGSYMDDYYYLPKVLRAEKYCNDIEYAKQEVQNKKQKYADAIMVIYRLRNQIVHDANSNGIATDFYVVILKNIANVLLCKVLHVYSTDKHLSVEEIITRLYSEASLFFASIPECSVGSLIF